MTWILTTCRAAADFWFLAKVARAAHAARRTFLSSLAVLFFATSAQAAFVRIGPFTNSITHLEADTNDVIVTAVSGPIANADGSFTTKGLPMRLHLTPDGSVTNLFAENNYVVSNRFFENPIAFRVPLDSGPTVYSLYDLRISGYNYFVTQILNGGTNANVTYNQVTNGLGFLPLKPADTNGFIRLLQATNVANALILSASNSLYSDYTTKIAVISALTISSSNFLYGDYTTQIAALSARSLTNLFGTNAAVVSYANGRGYIPTNYDAAGTALAIGLQATNFTIAVSNSLAAQIGGAGISAVTATNISTNQVFLGTNGIRISTGLSAFVPTNHFDPAGTALAIGLQSTNFTIAVSNSLAGQIGAAGISAVTATNISANQVFLGTNGIGIASGLSGFVSTNRFDISGAAAAILPSPWHFNSTSANSLNLTNSTLQNTPLTIYTNGTVDWHTNALTNILSQTFYGTNGPVITEGGAWWEFRLKNWVQGTGIQFGKGANAELLFVSSANNDSFFIDPSGELVTAGPAQIGSTLEILDHFTSDDGAIASDSLGNLTAVKFIGSGNGLTNIPALGISTNGSAANQVLASIGGKTVFTNAAQVLGTGYTNGFLAAPDLQVSLFSGTNTYTGHSASLTNNGPFTIGTSVFQESFSGGKTTLQLTPTSPGATFKVNGNISGVATNTANYFFGDGYGLTNTTSTNLALGALAQVTNIASSLASSGINASTSTNIAAFQIGVSNATQIATNLYFAGAKLNKTNDISYNQIATNLAAEGNISFGATGQATNLLNGFGTNYIRLLGAGESSATNGSFIWVASLNLLTNWISGAYITNNGSAFLVKSNTTSLYTSPTLFGTYTSVSGVSPVPVAIPTDALNSDGFDVLGYLSPTNLNALFAAQSNATATASNGAIAVLNGTGINTTLIFTNAAWGLSNAVQGNTARAGMFAFAGISNVVLAPVSGIVGGFGNNVGSGGSYNFIWGGYSNSLSETALSTISGGQFNKISVGNFSTISGGLSNRIFGNLSINATYNTILGGFGNSILLPSGGALDFSTILGGTSNTITASGATAGGANVTLSNANTFGWSDGTALSSTTDSQVSFYAGNGYRFLGGPAQFDGNVTASGFTTGGKPLVANASLIPFTNSSAAGILSTNLGDAANTNLVYSDINGGMHRGAIGSGLSWNATTKTLSASGGGGSQTPIAQDVDYGGNAATNMSALKVTNAASIGGQTTVSALIVTNGVTNLSTLKVVGNQTNVGTVSVTGNQTNFGALYLTGQGFMGGNLLATTNQLLDGTALGASQYAATGSTTNFVSTQNGNNWTNWVAHTHEGTATNLTVTFNGTLQSFTCTNGPSASTNYFFHYAGANGSASFRFVSGGAAYNVLQFDYAPKWLSGSNNVITNGVLSITSYGGTNATQLEAAIRENQ